MSMRRDSTILASWKITGFDKHHRPIRWYILIGLIGFAFLCYAIITTNYLFAIIVVLGGAIIYIQDTASADQVPFAITTRGIKIGNAEHVYNEIGKFWIIYDPPEVKKLYFSFKGSFSPSVMIPLSNQNPLKIRDILLRFLEEDLEKEEEPLSETLARWSKIS